MKKWIAAALFCLFATACGSVDRTDGAKVAESFLNAYFNYDLEQAIELADSDTRLELEAMQQQMDAQGMTPSLMRAQNEKVLVKVNRVIVDGDSAVCSYTLRRTVDDANAMEDNLILTRNGENWEVKF